MRRPVYFDEAYGLITSSLGDGRRFSSVGVAAELQKMRLPVLPMTAAVVMLKYIQLCQADCPEAPQLVFTDGKRRGYQFVEPAQLD